MQPSVADGRQQPLGQICYVPLYIVPQGTAGGSSVNMALQSCAAAMAAAQSSAGITTATAGHGGGSAQPHAQFSFSPFLVQMPAPSASSAPSSSAPSSPGTSSSSPGSPGQIHAQHQYQRQQAQLAQLAQHYAALQHQQRASLVGTQPAAASGLAEYRLANFASLLPSAGGSAPQPQTQPGQLPSPFVVPSLAALPHLAAAASAGAHQQAHYPFPFQLQGSALFAAPPPAVVAEASTATSTCTTSSSDSAMTGGSSCITSCAASGKKEIKFKYHMSIMPQLASGSGAPAPPKVEMKKKRKPRMCITGRVCTHCGATKTTEWRMGPEGRGTLCNACGLRYRKKLLMDGQKDPNAKITMSMLLNATKKSTKPGSSSAKDEGPSSSPSRRSDDESP